MNAIDYMDERPPPKMEERLLLIGSGNRKLRYSEIITYRVAQLHTRFNAQSTRILQTVSDISLSQWRILTVVNSSNDVTHTKISSISRIDKGQISRAVKSLIKDGYLETEDDLDDHRKSYLRLTPQASELLAKTLPLMQKRHDVLTDSLSDDQRTVLFEAFDTLDNLTELTEFT
ncbi:hypothetical protein GCM10011498_27530 [Amylibacter cionae]|uniref:HTH marR-type domain-containing protein n=2 Tax=Neptunicoccus cionae TaxID=2035344 RepID=A0A916R055_9RHOB|nr:hypothetical protein GCM10011498_27530 [Amylibacter cionae]